MEHSSYSVFIHLVHCFSSSSSFFFSHSSLGTSKRDYKIREDPKPGKDGPALFYMYSSPHLGGGQMGSLVGTRMAPAMGPGRADFLGHCTPRNLFKLAPTQQGSPLEKFRANQGTVRKPKW